jgi:hypothetical protein
MIGFYVGQRLMGPVLGSSGAPRPAIAEGVPVVFVYPSKLHLHDKSKGTGSATHTELSKHIAYGTCVIYRYCAKREPASTQCGSDGHMW